ncbi:type I-E CRISPR-associated protein Cas6/Cse3/CasE [Streptacidiphilus sp. MAP5-3]|uniref:type I-E CRISPR-associated protein Cas6/Cse3/CasE n=1 Tax=unclassified Streptacidiphilus TaxID=2643834 RepID=UPI0035153761
MTTTATATAHLARLCINPRSREAMRDLRDAQAMHQRLMDFYPDVLRHGEQARSALGVLHRVERSQTDTTILVQSVLAPDTSRLPDDYLTRPADTRDLTPVLDWVADGRTLRYRIDVAPTRSVLNEERYPEGHPRSGQRRRGRRVPISGEPAIAWWERQAQRAGLDVQLVIDTPQTPAIGYRDTGRLQHSLTRFEGIATVTDTTALRTALLGGIGQGRAYGAGLLSIAPA